MRKLISVIIPAYNEEAVLNELRRRLLDVMAVNRNYDFEIIIVENGSWDSTFDMLVRMNHDDPRFKVVQLSRNFGPDGGITAGLSRARGDAAVIMNADLQDPPELVTRFIEEWENGYEIVYGIIKKRSGVSHSRKLLSAIAYKIINKMADTGIPENAGDFRLIDKKVYTIINIMQEKNKYLRGLIAWTGFKQLGIPYERPSRYAGDSKAGFSTAMEVALNGIFSFSYLPLRLATVVGFALSLISFILMIFELALFMIYGREVPGYTSTILIILFLFGMLFLLLGIVGIYLGRIYDEVKQRPNFIIKNEIGI